MTALERKIKLKIHEFDIISLIRLLESTGYSMEEIRFKGHNSICSQSRLIQDIGFKNEPVREVVITMNLGLLSPQSPLPNYFRKKLDKDIGNTSSFENFIGYFDHHLIKDYICNIYPEINRFFFPSWDLTRQYYLRMLDLKSISTIHWLFTTAFPELDVRVQKAFLNYKFQTSQICFGKTDIGSEAVLGGNANIPIYGLEIIFYSEDENTYTQIPWPREIKKRMKKLIFPILKPIGVDFKIYLVLRSKKKWARLHSETLLGYDRLQNDHKSYSRTKIFKGHVGELNKKL